MSKQRSVVLLATASVAGSTAILDASIVNLALPAIGEAFDTSASELGWVVNAYVLPFAVSILAVGRLGDGLGQRPVLAVGAGLFAISCAGAALAPSFGVLLIMRALQGLGASALLTLSLAVVSAGFEPARRPRALGIYFAAGATAGALGPIVGGVLTSAFGWPAMFAVQVPLAIVVLGAVLVFLDRPMRAHRPTFDVPGLALGTLVLVGVNVALLQGNEWGWGSPLTLGGWLLAVAALGLFILQERSAAEPAVRLGVFRNRRFVASSLAGALAWFGLLSGSVQLAIYLQAGRSLDPSEAALVITPWPLAALVVFLRSGAIVERFGSEKVMLWALIVASASAAVMPFFGAETPLTVVAAIAALGGAAIALSVTASTSCAIAEFPPAEAGIAAGIFNSLRQVGSALGVAIPAAAYDLATGGVLTGGRALRGSSWALGTRVIVFALVVALIAAMVYRSLLPARREAVLSHPGSG